MFWCLQSPENFENYIAHSFPLDFYIYKLSRSNSLLYFSRVSNIQTHIISICRWRLARLFCRQHELFENLHAEGALQIEHTLSAIATLVRCGNSDKDEANEWLIRVF